MNQNEQQNLKKTFHNDMITLYKRIRKELKYTPPQLFEMINKYGGYEAAIKFIITDMNTFVFTLLWENQRLDLSIEALITKETYRALFPEDVINFCQKRLEEYNYAPKILPKVETKEIDYDSYEELEHMFEDVKKSISPSNRIEEPQKIEHIIYTESININSSQWEALFINDAIFTSKNKDLLLRMFLMGGKYITHNALSQEEGYNSKYPFKEVITAIGKRIKSTLKLDMPKNIDGKAIPWHILFLGWQENNTEFSWSLRPELYHALENLLADNKIDITDISVKTTESDLVGSGDYELPDHEIQEVAEEEVPKMDSSENPIEHSSEVISEEPDFNEEHDIPELDLDINDLPFIEDDLYGSIDHLYHAPSQESDEYIDRPKREPVSAISLDDLIDSIFDLDHPAPKKTEAPSPKTVKNKAEEVKSQPSKIDQPQEVVIAEVVPVSQKVSLEEVKRACLEYYGAVCDICGFDFGYTYGEAFEHLIDIYSLDGKPVEENLELIDPQKDIIPICSNCKCVIESKVPAYTVTEIKQMLK